MAIGVDEPAKIDFLGKGIKFPFKITSNTLSKAGPELSMNEQKVIEAIRTTLGTGIGERPMRRDFGSALGDLPFEPNDETVQGIVRLFVVGAISKWNKRVRVVSSSIESRDNALFIGVQLVFIRTQTVGNLVFPFFKNQFGEVVIGEQQVENIFGTGQN